MLESSDKEVRMTAVEGLCKLLLACRITSSKLLSALVLLWYNPVTGEQVGRLRWGEPLGRGGAGQVGAARLWWGRWAGRIDEEKSPGSGDGIVELGSDV